LDSYPQHLDSYPQHLDSYPQHLDSSAQHLDRCPQHLDSSAQHLVSYPLLLDSYRIGARRPVLARGVGMAAPRGCWTQSPVKRRFAQDNSQVTRSCPASATHLDGTDNSAGHAVSATDRLGPVVGVDAVPTARASRPHPPFVFDLPALTHWRLWIVSGGMEYVKESRASGHLPHEGVARRSFRALAKRGFRRLAPAPSLSSPLKNAS
jgi:hypothetical protein